jgi:septum formation protein
LLREAGIEFVVQPANVAEEVRLGESPKACAERLAKDKALAVAKVRRADWVLGADTVVAVEGEILGKPVDAADAGRMLRLLSGREHVVITGVCLAGAAEGRMSHSNKVRSGVSERMVDVRSESTLVTFSQMSDQDIAEYVASGEPMDKAGAYGIQGLASKWIPRIEGDYSNVVGLPVKLVQEMMRDHGLHESP